MWVFRGKPIKSCCSPLTLKSKNSKSIFSTKLHWGWLQYFDNWYGKENKIWVNNIVLVRRVYFVLFFVVHDSVWKLKPILKNSTIIKKSSYGLQALFFKPVLRSLVFSYESMFRILFRYKAHWNSIVLTIVRCVCHHFCSICPIIIIRLTCLKVFCIT